MTTRRLVSRARVNAHTNLSATDPPPRTRSVVSKSARLNDEAQQKDILPGVLSQHHRSSSKEEKGDSERNIHVVIRCRQRSEREIQENSPCIVTSNGAKSKEVTVEVATPVSSMGVVTLPPLRTYPFDLVFGPEADQSLIYHEVVAPMLEEVLLGYNCTLFAYGQTGTGKTYTMQGDLNPTPMGNPSSHAGMIPRVLFRLFHQLEHSRADYSVKVSYIELYNEELRDLLANDLAAPIGSMPPMGVASKDYNRPSDNGLKIFDDSAKRGVTIQGLEEIVVKDSQSALALLTKGSMRRQIAATKFNDHSSRSHSIFSITVHVKEAGMVGEELLKVGKLNLVDLAGSENIGRSGAENKRAREAGMINQSLLTLGRVINALVDKASHVPYRESKLTRLLQDSLGGCTKTCIIATISPARSNMEETLSTLDYALRAKSIRNRPELNQRTSRNSLLKDYVSEIERLKADLVAAREKNGIFLSEESWNQMSAEQELRSTELEEAKKQVQIVEANLRAVRDEFDQSIGLLKLREGELKETKKQLHDAEQALERTETEVFAIKTTLLEENVVRQAHEDTEVALDRIARGLKKVAQRSLQDLGALFEKLERKTIILHSNSNAVMTQGKTISLVGCTMVQALDEFTNSSAQKLAKIDAETAGFREKELNVLTRKATYVDEQLTTLQHFLSVIRAKDELETEALAAAHDSMQKLHEAFAVEFHSWCSALDKTCETVSQKVTATATEACTILETALQATVSLTEKVVQEAIAHIKMERDAGNRARLLLSEVSRSEVARLQQQNDLLLETLETEKLRGSRAKDELIQRISFFLSEFTMERDKNIIDATEAIRQGNNTGEEAMRTLLDQHNRIMETVDVGAVAAMEKLHRRNDEGRRTGEEALEALSGIKPQLNDEISRMRGVVSKSIMSYSTQLRKRAASVTQSCENAFTQQRQAKRARVEAVNILGCNIESDYRSMQSDIASISRSITSIVDKISDGGSELSSATSTYFNTASTSLTSLQSACEILSTDGAKEDNVTGTTPCRRTWDYIDHWDLTKPRETILTEWRGNTTSRSRTAEEPPEELVSDTENIPVVGHPGTSIGAFKVPPDHLRGPLPLVDAKNIYLSRGQRRAR